MGVGRRLDSHLHPGDARWQIQLHGEGPALGLSCLHGVAESLRDDRQLEGELIGAAPRQLDGLLVTIIPAKERADLVGQINPGGFDFEWGPQSDPAVARLDGKRDSR